MDRPDSGQFSPNTTTCGACHRMVRLIDDGSGARVAADPEIITVVTGGAGPRLARRLHAELCERYQEDARRQRTTAALKRYNRRHGRESGL
jgi:hypothetical protein